VEEKRKKKMKNRLWTMAGALALLAVVGKFYALPAIAQTVRAALVKNIDERGRNPYSAHVACGFVPPAFFCDAAPTSPVPAGMRLVVEYVNMQVAVSRGAVLNSPILFTNVPDNIFNYIPTTFALSNGESDIYVGRENLVGYVEAGNTPFIQIRGNGTFIVNGLITGYLINLNN
jgi:hypothetical protein